jgi:hypothetical protein
MDNFQPDQIMIAISEDPMTATPSCYNGSGMGGQPSCLGCKIEYRDMFGVRPDRSD